jgi:adenylate kinase family enzyme
VIGALASFLAGAASERARWRREQSSRWDDKRAQAYADYGYAVKNVYVQCMRVAAMRSRRADGDLADYDDALAAVRVLTDERTAKWESVLLLGNPRTVAAARTWHRRVWQVERFARGERTDIENWDALMADIMADRARFYAEARRDLGITSGELPSSGRWDADPDAGAVPVAPTGMTT